VAGQYAPISWSFYMLGRARFFSAILLSDLLLSLTPSARAAPEPKILHLSIQADPSSLDPYKVFSDSLVLNLFEGLTILSASDIILPGMATSWETSADGLVWTFHLRDATWSDGAPLTAEDFVYSFRRAVDPATACACASASVLNPIAQAEEINSGHEKDLTKLGVIAVEPHTLRLTLARPTPWLPALMANQVAMPVPRQAIDKWGDKWATPGHMVSNGPFILEKWVPLGEIDFIRNPRFHDAASVKLDGASYSENGQTALKRYEAGELDMLGVTGRELPRIMQERSAELHTTPLLGTTYVIFNMGGAFGADARIRQALAMVIDRDVLEGKVIRRNQPPAYTVVPPGIAGYTPPRPDWADLPMPERVALAKKLLADAEAPMPLKLHLLSIDLDFAKLYTSTIIEMWHASLGAETELETGEPRVLGTRVQHHDFEITINGVEMDFADPISVLETLRSDAGGRNFSNYKNASYDTLLDRSRADADPSARLKLLEAAEALMLSDQPVIPLDYRVAQTLVSPRVRGWETAPLGRHPLRFLSLGED
jgi:oligopeptide transport system substrate-binding protein